MSDTSTSSPTRYYGKYRGLVLVNIDPLQIGRIIAQVSDVLGETPSSWALPCVPAGGIQNLGKACLDARFRGQGGDGSRPHAALPAVGAGRGLR